MPVLAAVCCHDFCHLQCPCWAVQPSAAKTGLLAQKAPASLCPFLKGVPRPPPPPRPSLGFSQQRFALQLLLPCQEVAEKPRWMGSSYLSSMREQGVPSLL